VLARCNIKSVVLLFKTLSNFFFFFSLGGVEMSPLCSSASIGLITPAPDAGEIKLGGEAEVLGDACPRVKIVHHKSHITSPGIEHGLPLKFFIFLRPIKKD
jgi:hypothetical protein